MQLHTLPLEPHSPLSARFTDLHGVGGDRGDGDSRSGRGSLRSRRARERTPQKSIGGSPSREREGDRLEAGDGVEDLEKVSCDQRAARHDFMHGRSWRGEGVLFAPKFNTARREQKILTLQFSALTYSLAHLVISPLRTGVGAALGARSLLQHPL